MGSYITVGMVYAFNEYFINEVSTVIQLLSVSEQEIQYRYSKDEFGELWIEKKCKLHELLNYKVLQELIDSYNQEVILNIRVSNFEYRNVVIRIIKESEYLGIQLDIAEELIVETGYDVFEKEIVKLLEEVFLKSSYDYAFCEHEGEIEKSLNEILSNMINQYSLLILEIEGSLTVIKGDWLLDGVTNRPQ